MAHLENPARTEALENPDNEDRTADQDPPDPREIRENEAVMVPRENQVHVVLMDDPEPKEKEVSSC